LIKKCIKSKSKLDYENLVLDDQISNKVALTI